ncbi:hypothetical protein BDZ91DRAFT_275765 [Kalaharituber pfeilii]|nr:hypothetical protein BDZ91DRAFT_275765 [Kalaharituber pfeilii]
MLSYGLRAVRGTPKIRSYERYFLMSGILSYLRNYTMLYMTYPITYWPVHYMLCLPTARDHCISASCVKHLPFSLPRLLKCLL